MEKDSPRSYGKPPCQGWTTSYELLVREAREAPQTIKSTPVAVGCMPKLDLQLKTLHVHAVTAGQQESKLGLNWKPPAW